MTKRTKFNQTQLTIALEYAVLESALNAAYERTGPYADKLCPATLPVTPMGERLTSLAQKLRNVRADLVMACNGHSLATACVEYVSSLAPLAPLSPTFPVYPQQ